MKGQIFIKWFLAIFIISILTLLILSTIFPRLFELIIEFLSQASSDVVASQLSALISTSGSATSYIEIEYSPTKHITYDVSSVNRRLTVIPRYEMSFLKNLKAERLYPVNLTDFEYKNVNIFKIKKEFDEKSMRSVYTFSATKWSE
ncbi:MAG: hypothetical protein N3D78_02455 [Candidatus Aenigmarchaeota archaeon]|nr:hypothetical protein [Candidatus Aenigmarchaeota archaeon]